MLKFRLLDRDNIEADASNPIIIPAINKNWNPSPNSFHIKLDYVDIFPIGAEEVSRLTSLLLDQLLHSLYVRLEG